MVLPFIRELLADAEKSLSFLRAASHLKSGTGRIRVSGLTPTAKALHFALFHRAAGRPLIIEVRDNAAAEELLPVLQSSCELTGAASPDSVVYLPNRDVLPFENLSPHPEIQEARAKALWKIAAGAVLMWLTACAGRVTPEGALYTLPVAFDVTRLLSPPPVDRETRTRDLAAVHAAQDTRTASQVERQDP